MRTLTLALLALGLAALLPTSADAEHRHRVSNFSILSVRAARHDHVDALRLNFRAHLGSYSYQQPAQLVLRDVADPCPAPVAQEQAPAVDPCQAPLQLAAPRYGYSYGTSGYHESQAIILRQRFTVPHAHGLRLELRGRY